MRVRRTEYWTESYLSRFSPALVPRLAFRGADVVEVLERVGREVGLPSAIRVDQGTEFVSRDLDLWAYQRGVTLDFSPSSAPMWTKAIAYADGLTVLISQSGETADTLASPVFVR